MKRAIAAIAAGLGACGIGTAAHWLPLIEARAWPMAIGFYALLTVATVAAGATAIEESE